jgi:poly-beta-hydroxyalkanoate depolymerase
MFGKKEKHLQLLIERMSLLIRATEAHEEIFAVLKANDVDPTDEQLREYNEYLDDIEWLDEKIVRIQEYRSNPPKPFWKKLFRK